MKITQFKNCISIDIETTGLNPQKHTMISCGAINFRNNETFYEENYLRSDAHIDEEALKINGEDKSNLLSRNYLSYKSEIEVLDSLLKYASENKCFVIIGKNPKFDYNFLLEIWKRNSREERKFPFSYRVIDYGSLALPLMLKAGLDVPEKGFSSSDIQNFLKLVEEPRPHNALTGAKYNKYCLENIISLYNKNKTGKIFKIIKNIFKKLK